MSACGDNKGSESTATSKPPSRIPRFQRSQSLRLKRGEGGLLRGSYSVLDLSAIRGTSSNIAEDDTESVRSFASSISTFSGMDNRSKSRYRVHCHHAQEEEYLTPTQRKDRLIRHLKSESVKMRRECDEKDAEIIRLTKKLETVIIIPGAGDEVFEEKIGKDDRISTSDLLFHSNSSCDSGLGEVVLGGAGTPSDSQQLLLEELKRNHQIEYQGLKERYNDRIENLLQKLSDANTRYCDLRPLYDITLEKNRTLTQRVERLEKELAESEARHHQMYLKMYKKGQDAANLEHADAVMEFAHKVPSQQSSVSELLHQLHSTQIELDRLKCLYRQEMCKSTSDSSGKEAEMRLKFLKDAIYYFFTERDNRSHLRAIESIMGFDETEKLAIERALVKMH